jgi:spore germination protein YaaH
MFASSHYVFPLLGRCLAVEKCVRLRASRRNNGGKIMVATNNQTKAISDLEYDLVAVLKNKAEAVQLYSAYIQDAQKAGSQPCVELLQQLQEADMNQVQEIRRHLQEVMQKGKM